MPTDLEDDLPPCGAPGYTFAGQQRACERGRGHDGPHGTLHRGPDAEVDGYVSFDPFVETQRVKSHAESFAEGERAATERIAEFAEREATRLERRGDNYGTLAAVALDNFAHAIRDGRRIDPEGELR